MLLGRVVVLKDDPEPVDVRDARDEDPCTRRAGGERRHGLLELGPEAVDRGHAVDRAGANIVGAHQDGDIGDLSLVDGRHLSPEICHLGAADGIVEVPFEDRRLRIENAQVVGLA